MMAINNVMGEAERLLQNSVEAPASSASRWR
jgi:hypothetical protein